VVSDGAGREANLRPFSDRAALLSISDGARSCGGAGTSIATQLYEKTTRIALRCRPAWVV